MLASTVGYQHQVVDACASSRILVGRLDVTEDCVMDWKTVEEIAGVVQKSIASAAIVIGGWWAYFRFVRFRTLRPRLEFNFECSRSDIDASDVLVILTLKLTNTGHTEIELRRSEKPRCFLKYALISDRGSGSPVAPLTVSAKRLQHLDIVFVAHRRVEPGETVDDVKVLRVNKTGILAIQIELVVFGFQKWSASSAFPLIGQLQRNDVKSEDEQDEYEEAEALREGLRNVLARIKQLNESERSSLQLIEYEVETLLKESNAAGNFVGRADDLSTKAEKALGAIL